jgi:hypothetical protein
MLEGSLQGEYNKYLSKPIIDTLIKTKIDSVKRQLGMKLEVKSEKTQTKQKDS